MRRTGYIVILLAVLAWGVAAIVLGSPSLDLSGGGGAGAGVPSADGASPACLPAGLEHPATLPGTDVDVSPEPESVTASPHTQVSFLGVPAAQLHDVSVTGARSGSHGGRLRPYSQGDGASFVPAEPFDAGERVTVRARVGAGAGRAVAFGFRVDTPYPTAHVGEFPNPAAAPADYQSFATMPGVQAPVLDVTAADRDPGAGDVFTTNGPGPGQYGPLIYTPQGRLVWFEKLPAGETAEDLSEQTYEGRRDLTWWRGRVLSLGFGQGEDLVMDSGYRTVARVRGGNGLHADLHDFQIVGRDVAYITAFNPIRCDLSSAGGPRGGAIIDTAIQEIDMKTGLVRWEWHSLDHVGVSESETSPPKSTAWDWFHINSIDPEPDGDLFISARSTWAGYQLQAGSGSVLWRLGGTKSSFKMGPGTKTAWQHDGRLLSSGVVTLFDDGSNPRVHGQSRAVRIALDFATHEARLLSALTHRDPPLLAASQGNMQTLADGDTVVDYGGVPEISEYAPDGALLFDSHLSFSMATYRGFRYPWSARPQAPPALLASLNDTAEETIVRMSWNGATGVARWRVLAGSRRGALASRATVAAQGFESTTILPLKYAYAQVQALDAAGAVIGSSPVARVVSYKTGLRGGGVA
ncbi:MAG TPA: arylsulfotransferase family protein [Solirubrobacteraceae bacterium]|nr:arylsulfotransferase family protein [Solirubrobacteraceae bacterium]